MLKIHQGVVLYITNKKKAQGHHSLELLYFWTWNL